jgi:hypothetical protein
MCESGVEVAPQIAAPTAVNHQMTWSARAISPSRPCFVYITTLTHESKLRAAPYYTSLLDRAAVELWLATVLLFSAYS